MKMISTWFQSQRGLAIGTIVGALTVGKATPYLVHAIPNVGVAAVIVTASSGAVIAALLVATSYHDGPYPFTSRPFSWGLVVTVARVREWRLATSGYLGHMWELYALWSWLAAFFVAARQMHQPSAIQTGTVTFLAIGVAGLAGAIAAGHLADRLGRTAVTSAAMVVSAACCLASPLAFASTEPVLIGVLLVWGASVIADSAQFSAAVTELAEPRYAGSVLALQLALGFTLTIVSIRLVPIAVEVVGWRYALLPLAVGPVAGAVAMLRLRLLPESVALANGRR
jgi:hypothetical protein